MAEPVCLAELRPQVIPVQTYRVRVEDDAVLVERPGGEAQSADEPGPGS